MLPLVGYARNAMAQAISQADGEWLKKDFGELTAHSLRHTFRDRLRASECPLDLIDQIGGWKSVGGVGVRYGEGYSLEQQRIWVKANSVSINHL